MRASGALGPDSTRRHRRAASSQSPSHELQPAARAELPDPADRQVALDRERQADAEQLGGAPEPPLLDVEVGEVAVAARVDLVEVLVGPCSRIDSVASRLPRSPSQHVADAVDQPDAHRRASGRRCRRRARPLVRGSSSRPVEVAGLQGEVGLHRERVAEAARSASRPRRVVARRAPRRPRRRGARRRSRSALYQWYTASAWWLALTPPASSARSPQEPSPARWRRWRRRGGRSGSTRRPAARAARPRRPPTSGAPCSSADARRTRPPGVCAPERAAARPASAAWRSVAGRVAGAEGVVGRARPDPRPARTRGRRASGGGATTSPPGGMVSLIAMPAQVVAERHAARARAGSARRRRGRAAAGSPMPRRASRWSGIASGAQARRCSRSQASASRRVVRARMASRTVRGSSLPSWSSISTTKNGLPPVSWCEPGRRRPAGRSTSAAIGVDAQRAERHRSSASGERATSPSSERSGWAVPSSSSRSAPTTSDRVTRCGGAGSAAGRWCPGRPSAGRRRRAPTACSRRCSNTAAKISCGCARRASSVTRRRRAAARRRGAGRAAAGSTAGRTRPTGRARRPRSRR